MIILCHMQNTNSMVISSYMVKIFDHAEWKYMFMFCIHLFWEKTLLNGLNSCTPTLQHSSLMAYGQTAFNSTAQHCKAALLFFPFCHVLTM